jgi:hypothetical protein
MQIKNINKFIAFHAELRIHIGYIQIRIQHFSADPDPVTDLVTDPGF